LVYLRARYYAPGMGRFLTRDTWEGGAQFPLSFNRWNYTEANPINNLDPSGKYSIISTLYGIQYTVRAGHTWTAENQAAVETAVILVANRFVRSLGIDYGYSWVEPAVFRKVYGIHNDRLMEFLWGGDDCYYCRPDPCKEAKIWENQDPNECNCESTGTCNCQPVGGYTHTAQKIEFASMWDNYSGVGGTSVQNLRKVNNVIHELGHAFSARLGNFPRQNVAGYSTEINGEKWKMNSRIPDKYGFYEDALVSGTRTWVQSGAVDDLGSEVFADMFLGWVYDKWASDKYGIERANFMNTRMPGWIRQAMALP